MQINTNINGLDYDSSPTTSTASAATSVNDNNNTNNNNNQNNSNRNYNSNNNELLNLNVLHKIIDDFEWVRNAVSIRRNTNNTPPRNILIRGNEVITLQQHRKTSMQNLTTSQQPSTTSLTTIETHVTKWLIHNLNADNLCGFLQYLVTDKELLEEHYREDALLRQEKYVTILVIGLTAFETHQYGLLSQIDAILKADDKETKHHKRSNSQPNVIIVPKNIKNNNRNSSSSKVTSCNQSCAINTSPNKQQQSALVLLTIRKTKSLPEFAAKTIKPQDELDVGTYARRRPRCKTLATIKPLVTEPQNIPRLNSSQINPKTSHATTSTSSASFLGEYDDNQPSTSQASSNRSKSPLSNYTLNSNKSNASSLMSTSASSCNSNNTAKCIQLINTDNIKIWTDHSWELKQKNKQQNQQQPPPTAACAIPTTVPTNAKPSKSLSPLNSFFSSLFSTPPSYTSWFIDHDNQNDTETTETAIESIIPDNNNYQQNHHSVMSSQTQLSSLSLGSTVFDKFLPIDGKKLRTRKSQNLFEDVNSTLDCTGLNMLMSSATNLSTESQSSATSPGSVLNTPKNCQSLTRFLQMSHLSRNNTELEKENAHFRISEAIISAIEHIKWNKLENQKDRNDEGKCLFIIFYILYKK